MIVKNEEHNIERALSWGKELFFEQIVIDTGHDGDFKYSEKNVGDSNAKAGYI